MALFWPDPIPGLATRAARLPTASAPETSGLPEASQPFGSSRSPRSSNPAESYQSPRSSESSESPRSSSSPKPSSSSESSGLTELSQSSESSESQSQHGQYTAQGQHGAWNSSIAHERDYAALYTHILFDLFNPSRPGLSFYICPQALVSADSGHATDLCVFSFGQDRELPVLFVEIKPPSWFRDQSKRRNAIRQMADRFDRYFKEYTTLEELWGLQVIGARWRLIYVKKGEDSRKARMFLHNDGQIGLGDAGSGILFDQIHWRSDIVDEEAIGALTTVRDRIDRLIETGYVHPLDLLPDDPDPNARRLVERHVALVFSDDEMSLVTSASHSESDNSKKDSDYQPDSDMSQDAKDMD